MPRLRNYPGTDCFGHKRYPEPARRAIEAALEDDSKKVQLEESQFTDPETYDWSQVRIDNVKVPGTWKKGF